MSLDDFVDVEVVAFEYLSIVGDGFGGGVESEWDREWCGGVGVDHFDDFFYEVV